MGRIPRFEIGVHRNFAVTSEPPGSGALSNLDLPHVNRPGHHHRQGRHVQRFLLEIMRSSNTPSRPKGAALSRILAHSLLWGLACLLLPGCQEIVEQEARDDLEKAHAALDRGEWETANELFYETMTQDPSLPEAWAGRGMALTRLDESEAAREHYEEARNLLEERLARDPEDRVAFHQKIIILILLGESDRARELASEAAARNPEDPFFENLGALIDEVEAQYASEILPKNEEPREEIEN